MADKYNFVPPVRNDFVAPLEPWMTGGAGAGQIAATQVSSWVYSLLCRARVAPSPLSVRADASFSPSGRYGTWPPASLANVPLATSLAVAALPTYTATGAALALPSASGGTPTAAITPVLATPYFTPIAGCSYPDPWQGAGVARPTAC